MRPTADQAKKVRMCNHLVVTNYWFIKYVQLLCIVIVTKHDLNALQVVVSSVANR